MDRFSETIPLPPGYDDASAMDRLCRYHLWQAVLDWQGRNFRTIGVALQEREEVALQHADFDGLDVPKTFDLFRTWSKWLRYDSGLVFDLPAQ